LEFSLRSNKKVKKEKGFYYGMNNLKLEIYQLRKSGVVYKNLILL